MTWIAPSPTPLLMSHSSETTVLFWRGFLPGKRHTLLNKCAGLTGEQLAQRAVTPSNLSLLGLVRHMGKVERTWFRQRAAGEPVGPLYDQGLDKDADFNDLDPARAEDDFARFVEECRLADAAVADTAFDATFTHNDELHSLRLVYVHMNTEYARHNGHADLLRECIDGTTGA
jgi:hypothetical protein